MSFSSASRWPLSAAGSKIVREQLQLVAERTNVAVAGGHGNEASARSIYHRPMVEEVDYHDGEGPPAAAG
jgi:hypothetical protein